MYGNKQESERGVKVELGMGKDVVIWILVRRLGSDVYLKNNSIFNIRYVNV